MSSPKLTPPIVFLDTETTSLNRRTRQAWEIALIIREPDGTETENTEFVSVDLAEADPMSLRIGRYFDRHPDAGPQRVRGDLPLAPVGAARWVERATRGAILVGAVPSFDEETLAQLLFDHGLCPSWHYHLVDIETLAAGAMQITPPWNFDTILAAYGLTYDEADRHTALGDARMVRDLYDAVMAADR